MTRDCSTIKHGLDSHVTNIGSASPVFAARLHKLLLSEPQMARSAIHFFFLNDPPPTNISPLPLPDALPIFTAHTTQKIQARVAESPAALPPAIVRSVTCGSPYSAWRWLQPPASAWRRLSWRTANVWRG